jgi:hypothetical protein
VRIVLGVPGRGEFFRADVHAFAQGVVEAVEVLNGRWRRLRRMRKMPQRISSRVIAELGVVVTSHRHGRGLRARLFECGGGFRLVGRWCWHGVRGFPR